MKKPLYLFVFLIIPYFLGMGINYYFGIIPYPGNNLIEIIINHIMFFYTGLLPILIVFGIYLRIKNKE